MRKAIVFILSLLLLSAFSYRTEAATIDSDAASIMSDEAEVIEAAEEVPAETPEDVTEDVTEFMSNFTTVHYAFDEGAEGYDYIEF